MIIHRLIIPYCFIIRSKFLLCYTTDIIKKINL
nr:MAG TPA: hypothetical protein [Caudoviricetes sp.]